MVEVYRGADQIEKEELLGLEVDLLCPCANSRSITVDNAGRVVARVISPGANAPTTARGRANSILQGVLPIPDCVANCGGVLAASMRRVRLRKDSVRRFVDQRFRQKVTEVIKAAERGNMSSRKYAERMAEGKFLG